MKRLLAILSVATALCGLRRGCDDGFRCQNYHGIDRHLHRTGSQ